MNNCKDCAYRSLGGLCENPNITENCGEEPSDAMLVYSYREGGSFYVGPNFGCVHWLARGVTP